jgi:two-component system response regulator DctR
MKVANPSKEMQPVVYLVEDDLDLAQAMQLLFKTEGLRLVHFDNGKSFLHDAKDPGSAINMAPAACVLLDIRLGSMSGLEVFEGLQNLDSLFIHPVIFLTGHADLQIAIDVMRKGAADFVTKPFDSLFLLQKVKLGLDKSAQLVEEREFRNEFLALLNDLSDREMTVLRHVVAGLHNKEIAELLGNSSRTVEIHRANMFEKMGVKSAIELARLMERHGSDK